MDNDPEFYYNKGKTILDRFCFEEYEALEYLFIARRLATNLGDKKYLIQLIDDDITKFINQQKVYDYYFLTNLTLLEYLFIWNDLPLQLDKNESLSNLIDITIKTIIRGYFSHRCWKLDLKERILMRRMNEFITIIVNIFVEKNITEMLLPMVIIRSLASKSETSDCSVQIMDDGINKVIAKLDVTERFVILETFAETRDTPYYNSIVTILEGIDYGISKLVSNIDFGAVYNNPSGLISFIDMRRDISNSNSNESILPTIDNILMQFTRLDPVGKLPNEILHEIFSHLEIHELAPLEAVSKRWYNYLQGDSLLWNLKELDELWTEEKLIKILERIATINSPTISLHLERFKDKQSELKCIELIKNPRHRKDIFDNIILQKLFYKPDWLEINNSPETNNSLESNNSLLPNAGMILLQYTNLEVLILNDYQENTIFNFLCTYHTCLKRLKITTADDLSSLSLISIIEYCPNLEYLDLTIQEFDTKIFNINIDNASSNLKGIAINNSWIRPNRFHTIMEPEGTFDDADEGLVIRWPEGLSALSLLNFGRGTNKVIRGNLEQLEILIIRSLKHALNFFENNNIGNNLIFLGIFKYDGIYDQDFEAILKKCPNLRFISAEMFLTSDDNFASLIMNYSPKIEEIAIENYGPLNKMITAAASYRTGLKHISIVQNCGTTIFNVNRLIPSSFGDVTVSKNRMPNFEHFFEIVDGVYSGFTG